MKRAGYIQKSGYPAKDYDGSGQRILEICISKKVYAVSVRDIRRILYTNETGTVWYLKHNWGRYLNGAAGKAVMSRSKKAVNFIMENMGIYTVSVAALKNILSGYAGYSSVSEIEITAAKKTTSYQSAISPWIAV
ncbi:hypothetical protein J2128_001392 [Methanomicrobium sp. W14]|uniref:hypothetical protein n=1 Tax=Methanomicrobium sp. W14 TaxID=2817839 RepID=UPI001AEB0767|nr:hypothetical protein [Methanomicrobium sp. W14]MBP2133438.1 hypothetical protein [Methanomicrobium sp. W14]